MSVMLDTLNAARIATVPVPLKFTQAFALPSTTVATGTDLVPAAFCRVSVLIVLMRCFQRNTATLQISASVAVPTVESNTLMRTEVVGLV